MRGVFKWTITPCSSSIILVVIKGLVLWHFGSSLCILFCSFCSQLSVWEHQCAGWTRAQTLRKGGPSFILDPQSTTQHFVCVGEAPPTHGYTTRTHQPRVWGFAAWRGPLTLVLFPDCLLLSSHGRTAGCCSAGSRLPVCRSPFWARLHRAGQASGPGQPQSCEYRRIQYLFWAWAAVFWC